MRYEGLITTAELQATSLIMYYRTKEEVAAPFNDTESTCYKQGLRLVSCETAVTKCPYHQSWLADGGDARAHAKRFVPTMRTWSNSTFETALDSQNRSVEERAGLVDELFQRLENDIAESPEDYPMD